MISATWRYLRLPILALWYLTAFVVAGLATAKQFDWPSSFWSSPPAWVVVLFVVSATAAAMLPLRGAYSENRSRQKRAQQILTNYARLMFIDFMEDRSSLALNLAVHIWRTRRRPRLAWPPWEDYMSRVVTFRLTEIQPSGVRWVKGKGVIGRAWATGDELVADLRGLQATAAQNETAFRKLGPDDTWGLSWDDLTHTRSYTAIYAAPLKKGRRVIGCVTADATHQNAISQLEKVAQTRSVRENISAMAKVLAEFEKW